jgi:cobalamin biosynthesis Mg chelatase CobN
MYGKDIKRYAQRRELTKTEITDLVNKTRLLFDLKKEVDVEKFIRTWSPEDFINKVDFEIEKAYDSLFDIEED